jgi:hypothetical protein
LTSRAANLLAGVLLANAQQAAAAGASNFKRHGTRFAAQWNWRRASHRGTDSLSTMVVACGAAPRVKCGMENAAAW